MSIDVGHEDRNASRPGAEPASGPDLDAELRRLLREELIPPVLLVLPGAAVLVRPVPRRRRR
jgi:hypothetical protein